MNRKITCRKAKESNFRSESFIDIDAFYSKYDRECEKKWQVMLRCEDKVIDLKQDEFYKLDCVYKNVELRLPLCDKEFSIIRIEIEHISKKIDIKVKTGENTYGIYDYDYPFEYGTLDRYHSSVGMCLLRDRFSKENLYGINQSGGYVFIWCNQAWHVKKIYHMMDTVEVVNDEKLSYKIGKAECSVCYSNKNHTYGRLSLEVFNEKNEYKDPYSGEITDALVNDFDRIMIYNE